MKRVALFSLAGVLACNASSKREEGPGSLPQELMEADRVFARETSERGAVGWADAFASDGKLFSGGTIIQGHSAIEEAMAVLDEPDYTLMWEPEFAEASGDLGYTHGTYRRESVDANGNPVVETGRYVTVWRREEDGTWKAIIDIGSAAPQR